MNTDVDFLLGNFSSLLTAPRGLESVRRILLTLASQGQLVAQDASDEPAERVLDRIAAERETRIARGELRRQAPRPKPDGPVPVGWESVDLGTVLDLEYGHALPAKARAPHGQIPVYGSNGVVGFHDEAFVEQACVIVGRKGSAGAVNITPGPCWPIDTTYFVRPFGGMDLAFTALLVRTSGVDQLDRSTAVPGLNREDAYKRPVLLPPLAEQARIIAKLDELLGLVESLKDLEERRTRARLTFRRSAWQALEAADEVLGLEAALRRIESNWVSVVDDVDGLADVDQAVLQLAVKGYLVSQDPSEEPASAMVRRSTQARDRAARRVRLASDRPDYQQTAPLPPGWVWAPMQDLVRFVDYRGRTPTKTSDGVRLITAKNIRRGYIDPDPAEFVSEATYTEWMTRGLPRVGDVLFTTEAPMGNAALVRDDERFALAQRTINLAPHADLSGDYLELLLLSPWFQRELARRATGMTATGIKAAKLKLIRVPVPPLGEQLRIVAAVGRLRAKSQHVREALNAREKAGLRFAACIG